MNQKDLPFQYLSLSPMWSLPHMKRMCGIMGCHTAWCGTSSGFKGPLRAASYFPLFRTPVIYSLSSSHSGPSVLRSSYAFAKGKPLDPRPPAAALGDARLSQTLKGLSARERGVPPTPFIPTRRVVVRHSPCTPWQPVRLRPKRGLPLSGHSEAKEYHRLSSTLTSVFH